MTNLEFLLLRKILKSCPFTYGRDGRCRTRYRQVSDEQLPSAEEILKGLDILGELKGDKK